MSMMMPPEAPPGMPLPPGGGGGPGMPMPPMDSMSSTPLPAEGGIEGLIAALGGGGGPMGAPGGLEGMGLPGGAMPGEEAPMEPEMSAVDHIQQAIKHMMMAMLANDDEEQSTQITKGLGPLQAILGGEQKKDKLLASAGG